MPALPQIRHLSLTPYEPTWRAMQAFTAARTADTADEIWLTEHPPTYTLGLAGKLEHVLDAGDIPVVKIDRGGQVTYHAPGQLVAYVLLDLKRQPYGVKELVRRLEEAIIQTLAALGVAGARQAGMPGVYVGGAKIAAIGLKVSRGATFHGLSLNIDMDLAAFGGINPCGYAGLASTSLAALGLAVKMRDVAPILVQQLTTQLYAHAP
jgi:lipoyl(octanoyl) transferase